MKQLVDIPGPKGHWLKGHLGEFEKIGFHQYVYKLIRQYGDICQIRLLKKKIVLISDAEVVQHILKSRPKTYRRASVMESIFKEMRVHGVFSAEGQEWKKQRRLMNPAFKPSQIKHFYPKIQRITQRLIQHLKEDNCAVDIQRVFMSYTVDITSTLAFGQDENTLQNPESVLQTNLNKIFPMMSFRLRFPIPYWRWFKLKKDKELDEAIGIVEDHVQGFIRAANSRIKACNKTTEEDADDLLEALILTRDEDGNTLSEEELFGNVITLLLAGEDTTANTLSWAIDFLADEPELQNKLYEEIHNSYPKADHISFDELDKYPLVQAVIQETMRLKPVAPYLHIEPLEDEEIKGYHIPKGTMLTVLLSYESFNESLFPEAKRFLPSRWLALSDETKKRYANTLMPFGYGSRLCPGMQLSITEMRIALIELLKHFKIERAESTEPAQEVLAFTVQPSGLRVNLMARN